jgi:hypothetical protein
LNQVHFAICSLYIPYICRALNNQIGGNEMNQFFSKHLKTNIRTNGTQ